MLLYSRLFTPNVRTGAIGSRNAAAFFPGEAPVKLVLPLTAVILPYTIPLLYCLLLFTHSSLQRFKTIIIRDVT